MPRLTTTAAPHTGRIVLGCGLESALETAQENALKNKLQESPA